MVVVAAETTVAAAAAVAAVEAPEVGVPLLTPGTRFVRSREARPDLPSGLSFLGEHLPIPSGAADFTKTQCTTLSTDRC
jgi:hypothetical protein